MRHQTNLNIRSGGGHSLNLPLYRRPITNNLQYKHMKVRLKKWRKCQNKFFLIQIYRWSGKNMQIFPPKNALETTIKKIVDKCRTRCMRKRMKYIRSWYRCCKDGSGAFLWSYTCWGIKITKNWLKVNYVLLLFESHSSASSTHPPTRRSPFLPREQERERFIYQHSSSKAEQQRREGGDAIKKKKNEEEVFLLKNHVPERTLMLWHFFH